jgi:hypothetical protein
MDKRVIGAISAAGVLLVGATIWAVVNRTDKPIKKNDPSSDITTTQNTQTTTTTTTATTAAQKYIIGSWDDKLAVFIPPDTSPYQLYDIYLASLPEEEQQKLREGIIVNDEQTLASLLEDYTS